MTRKCFFVEHVNSDLEYVTLTREVSSHVENVLRLSPGDRVELRDGLGNGWAGVIAGLKGGQAQVRIEEILHLQNESGLDLTLVAALARSDRMELVLRQATEMGVNRLVAFRAQRSQYGLSGPQRVKRLERWSRISREALCQCGRGTLPRIDILSGFEDLVGSTWEWEGTGKDGLKILACEEEHTQGLIELKRELPMCGHIVAVVGPEGGWTTEEVKAFVKAQFRTVHLGPRILRFETAAAALLSSVQLLWGDFGESRYRGG